MTGYILIKIPDSCDKCLMCERLYSPDRYGIYYCKKEHRNISYTADKEERPEWCPIKVLDERIMGQLENRWYPNSIKPEKDKLVIVKDSYDKEHGNHIWNGICWFVKQGEDINRIEYDVIAWKYQ